MTITSLGAQKENERKPIYAFIEPYKCISFCVFTYLLRDPNIQSMDLEGFYWSVGLSLNVRINVEQQSITQLNSLCGL